MADKPATWFHGLIAERTAAFATGAREVPFLESQIARFGQPVLDLGCGTGRLLLPLLQAGVDIDGSDVSADMLRHCCEKAAALGFDPRLYEQPMHALELPRTYRTIFIRSSLNLAGSRENGLATLRRAFAHLEEGGGLLFDIDAEYTDEGFWEMWVPARRGGLPEPWPQEGRRRAAPDGGEYVERQRMLSVDPLLQMMVRQVRIEKWAAGKLVASEEHSQRRILYLPNEVRLMLELVGFRDISIHDGCSDEPATPDSETLLFIARK